MNKDTTQKILLYPTEKHTAPVLVMVHTNDDGIHISWNEDNVYNDELGSCYKKSFFRTISEEEYIKMVMDSGSKLTYIPEAENIRKNKECDQKHILDMERIMKKIDDATEEDVSIVADDKIKEIIEFTKLLTKNDQVTFTTNLRIALDCFLSGTTILSNEEMVQYENMKRIFAEIKEI